MLYGGGSVDEDVHDHLQTLREKNRDLFMGIPIATGAIKTMRTNIVGSGLRLKSKINFEHLGISEINAKKIQKDIEREFSLWADSTDCDIERLDNFYELQQLAFLSWLQSGDVLATLPTTQRNNMPYDLRIRLIEADRLSTPFGADNQNIIGGVETNSQGEVVAYHFCKHHPLAALQPDNEWERVDAYGKYTGRRNVIHVMNRERIGQLRGVPFLSPVISSLKQLGRYMDAELVAAVVSGLFTVFIEKDSDADILEGEVNDSGFGDSIPHDQRLYDVPNNFEMGSGSILDLNKGEKAVTATPGRPNSGFDPFMIAICRQIGAALEIPYEILVKHFTSSFSASRGALMEFWKMVRMYRGWLSADFCQPIYEEFLCEAVAKGRISAPGFFADPMIRKSYCGAQWYGPAQGLINPAQEVNAAISRVKSGFSTAERESMEMTGTDHEENMRQRKTEAGLMMEVQNIEQDGNEK